MFTGCTVFLVIRIHRASRIKIALSIYVKSLLYEHTAVKEVPFRGSVPFVEREKYLLCCGYIAGIEMSADLGKLWIV